MTKEKGKGKDDLMSFINASMANHPSLQEGMLADLRLEQLPEITQDMDVLVEKIKVYKDMPKIKLKQVLSKLMEKGSNKGSNIFEILYILSLIDDKGECRKLLKHDNSALRRVALFHINSKTEWNNALRDPCQDIRLAATKEINTIDAWSALTENAIYLMDLDLISSIYKSQKDDEIWYAVIEKDCMVNERFDAALAIAAFTAIDTKDGWFQALRYTGCDKLFKLASAKVEKLTK